MTDSKMSKTERDELSRLLRARSRLAKSVIDQRVAELLADAERQLATEYKIDDDAWRHLTAAATQAVKSADAELARTCHALGIPQEFRPSLSVSWWKRGENAWKERRAELRRVVQTRLDAMAREARVVIESKVLEGLTMLAAGALKSAEAREFLASMPTVEMLMPALDISALGPLALRERPESGKSIDEEILHDAGQ